MASSGLAFQALSTLADEVANILENHVKTRNMDASESQSGAHIQNSKPDSLYDLEPRLPTSRATIGAPSAKAASSAARSYPLGMVLQACPDIIDYARGGIAHWRDFQAAAALVRPLLGISPSAYEEACAVMGEIEAGVVVAAILQRGSAIGSAGGYLRELTRKAQAGQFSLGPMLMALIGSRERAKARLPITA